MIVKNKKWKYNYTTFALLGELGSSPKRGYSLGGVGSWGVIHFWFWGNLVKCKVGK